MADVTIGKLREITKGKNKGKTKRSSSPKALRAFSLLHSDDDGQCFYCGHAMFEHVMSYDWTYRDEYATRLAKTYHTLSCKACAGNKGTDQVVCFTIQGRDIYRED